MPHPKTTATDPAEVARERLSDPVGTVIKLRDSYPDKFTYVFRPSLTYEHIDLKVENPVLADVRVRRAVLHAMDRETLVNKRFAGMQPVATTWVNPLDPNYTKDVPTYAFDRAKAKALLADAGWTPGKDGICVNKDGTRLSIEYGFATDEMLNEETAIAADDLLRDAAAILRHALTP